MLAIDMGERRRRAPDRPGRDVVASMHRPLEMAGGCRIAACIDVSSLKSWLQHFARAIGVYGARYAHLGHGHATVGSGEPAMPARCLSTALRDRSDDEHAWKLFDPVRDRVQTAFAPFTWSNRTTKGVALRQQQWLEAERARGVYAGVAIPVQDHAAGPAYLSLFGTDDTGAARLLDEHEMELAYVGALFHARAKIVLALDSADPTAGELTPRERECLRLAASGSTVIETAGALGIAERTVEFHLGNAGSKLGAHNKVHAVAVALGQQLIRI